jgi:outer membrane immunogenic protein
MLSLKRTFEDVATAAVSPPSQVPETKASAMVDAAYNWTGFYAGLNAGAASTDGNLTAVTSEQFFEGRFTDTLRKTGFIGGGQIGYNYQSGMSVFGVEADAD